MYGVFSKIPFPEEIGQDTINKIDLTGRVIDFFGNPESLPVKVELNKNETAYKTQFNLGGAGIETVSDPSDGSWTALIPDNFFMPLDSYYRITINDVIFRKFLPDFPPQNSLNDLEDY